jgi:1,4-dihydroxy-2-naphthoate octaprenyltransferase
MPTARDLDSSKTLATWPGGLGTVWRLFLHLRLPFNYVLSPLFLWGAVVGGGSPTGDFWLGLVSFHVFLYGGTNMFNSYYDRDEGPIGGLERPPAVSRAMLFSSLALKGIGLLLAMPLGVEFCICYLLFVAYSVSYSHPAIRVKKHPFGSAVLVFFGQGVVGFVGGFLAGGGEVERLLEPVSLLACLGGALLVSGLYPLTQVYQVTEDAKRGDLTLARRLGPSRVYWYILTLVLAGMACTAAAYVMLGFTNSAILMATYLVGVAIAIASIRKAQSRHEPRQVYRRVMALNYLNATVFWLVLGDSFGILPF